MAENKDDIAQIFDLDRKQATRKLVENMEQCMRDIENAQEDLRQVVASAKEAEFSVREVAAMKTVAKLRIKDQLGAAREKMGALERVSEAVGCPLFDWAAGAREADKAA